MEATVAQAIILGGHDEELDSIMLAVEQRRTARAQHLFAELNVDDRVKVNTSCPKRYLIGATGTVVAKRITKITILFDNDIHDPYGKWAGQRCIMPPTMLEKIETNE